jgi:methylated-DNA-[protein]-cysteine S-methyltransferase
MRLLPESPVEFLAPLSRPPERVYVTEIDTPFTPLALAGEGEALLHIQRDSSLPRFIQDIHQEWNSEVIVDAGPFRELIRQLQAYFSGEKAPVRAVVRPFGTSRFIRDIHRLMTRIPFGETVSYGELALLAGYPHAFRAAGSACGKNHTLMVIPCHRVVAAHGIGGFGAGLDLKRQLLKHEGIEY